MAAKESEVTRLIKTTDQIKGQMISNVAKVEERYEKLQNLEETAEVLKESAGEFQKQSKKVLVKKKWEHYKLWCILICVISSIVIILLVIIGLIIIFVMKPWQR